MQLEQTNFKMDSVKKIDGSSKNAKKNRAEAEFIQVLSGCDSSNEDQLPMHLRQSQGAKNGKTPVSQLNKKNTLNKLQGRKNSTNQQESSQNLKSKTTKHAQQTSALNQTMIGQGKNVQAIMNASPNKKMNMSMANMNLLDEQKMLDQKESFVRTVFTARQKCEEFKSTIRQKEDGVIGRNYDNKKS